MRPLPKDNSGTERQPPVWQDPDLTLGNTLIRQVRKYELITPLFGGGVEAGVNDPTMLIRGTSVRGQLRFWWRATRGGEFSGSLDRMKEAEDRLWGAASTPQTPLPSAVQVEVRVTNRGRRFEVRNSRGEPVPISHPSQSSYGYVAFPLQDVNGAPGEVTEGVKFTLTLSFPAGNRKDVKAALWAWETFGGIGARTRRGFGALRLVSIDGTAIAPPQADAKTETVAGGLAAGLETHVSTGAWPANVPHLAAPTALRHTLTGTFNSPDQAWRELIGKLKAFRQDPIGRTPPSGTPRKPGRSKWPEPDAIRRLFPARTPAHAPFAPATPDKFPRAEFGLPIVLEFKRDDMRNGDPPKTTLEADLPKTDRFASPLILRPLACANGQAVGLAVVLECSPLPPLKLEGAPGSPTVSAAVTAAEATRIPPLGGNPNVLEAFLNTL